ncbi:RNA recognition motif aka RRM, RBD, or RNP domain-containing protein [Cladophialophora immunda]|nr:RNA recognition motif aka RRM, RBD, or RNP domain-containing protein [Cladophialophora immunda]
MQGNFPCKDRLCTPRPCKANLCKAAWRSIATLISASKNMTQTLSISKCLVQHRYLYNVSASFYGFWNSIGPRVGSFLLLIFQILRAHRLRRQPHGAAPRLLSNNINFRLLSGRSAFSDVLGLRHPTRIFKSPRTTRHIPCKRTTPPPYATPFHCTSSKSIPRRYTGRYKRFLYCQLINVRIVEDKQDRKPKGFGYVEFATLDGLKAALPLGGITATRVAANVSTHIRVRDQAHQRTHDEESSGEGHMSWKDFKCRIQS